MSLVTRCPQCRTLFRVTPPQLQAASGQVRCGRCTHVFDGYGALTPEGAASSDEVHASATPAAPEAAATHTSTSPAAAAMPGVPEAAAIRDVPRRLSPTARYALAIAVLTMVITSQVAYAFRAEFVARSLGLRGAVESICEFTGCTVPLPQRPDLLRIEASDVHMIDPNRPSLIQLTATLRSYAKHDLAYPALDLVLTNANEHALARRVFLPDEYVGPGRNPKAGVPPNAEITIALDLETGDLNAAGFRLDVHAAPSR
jgi:predicted Zn finger-like uncharacterized protein